MSKYGLALMLIAFLSSTSIALGQPLPVQERDILVHSYEGFKPDINKFVLEGRFKATGVFALVINRQDGEWNIRFNQPKSSHAGVILPILRYSPIHFSKVVVSTRSRSPNDKHILVAIPFGNPQTSCFENGDEIFKEVLLVYDSGKLVDAEELYYDDCKSAYRPLGAYAPDKP